MLSEQTRVVVEATLPAVADNIDEIARRFYAHMFHARPDLMDGLFNRGNQAQGAQQVALAGSVAAFATAALQDQLPEQLLMRISHSTPRSVCARTSTRQSMTTSSGRSPTFWATL